MIWYIAFHWKSHDKIYLILYLSMPTVFHATWAGAAYPLKSFVLVHLQQYNSQCNQNFSDASFILAEGDSLHTVGVIPLNISVHFNVLLVVDFL